MNPISTTFILALFLSVHASPTFQKPGKSFRCDENGCGPIDAHSIKYSESSLKDMSSLRNKDCIESSKPGTYFCNNLNSTWVSITVDPKCTKNKLEKRGEGLLSKVIYGGGCFPDTAIEFLDSDFPLSSIGIRGQLMEINKNISISQSWSSGINFEIDTKVNDYLKRIFGDWGEGYSTTNLDLGDTCNHNFCIWVVNRQTQRVSIRVRQYRRCILYFDQTFSNIDKYIGQAYGFVSGEYHLIGHHSMPIPFRKGSGSHD